MKPNTKENKEGMAMSASGIKLLLAGLLVMIAGYILLAGGASEDPNIFSYDIFNFRRMVAAPVVIVCGIVIEIVAIMRVSKK